MNYSLGRCDYGVEAYELRGGMSVTNHVIERIKAGLKKYQPILADAKARDISEFDTVVILGDMLRISSAIRSMWRSPPNLRSA